MWPGGTAGVQPGDLQRGSPRADDAGLLPATEAGRLDKAPSPTSKVTNSPADMKVKKPTALDRQYRYVAALQRRNRQRAAEEQQEQQAQHEQEQQLAEYSQQLRSTILAGDTETLKQTWEPAAAAARLKELQETAAEQTQQTLGRLSVRSGSPNQPFDPDTLRSTYRSMSPAAAGNTRSATNSPKLAAGHAPAAPSAEAAAGDDVDSFLDGLLQQATAKKAFSKDNKVVTPSSGSPAAPGSPAAATSRPGTAKSTSSKQHGRSKPAWALTEQQQANTEAAAAEAEEDELLSFAEQLDWQDLIGQLDDVQLAAAFQELETAEAAAAAGDPTADQNWRSSFVTALNHAALQNIAAAGASSNNEKAHSEAPSSASQIRRAEEKATRRQKLLDRLSRLRESSGASVYGGSVKGSGAGSIDGDRASMFGGSVAGLGAAGGAAADDWDRSTRVGDDDVGTVQQQLKVLEAEEVLAENPEMKGVHSIASIKTMLRKKESQQH